LTLRNRRAAESAIREPLSAPLSLMVLYLSFSILPHPKPAPEKNKRRC
jgi:hypothetical protein